MFQQTTGLKALSSVAIFKKTEDHFEQNPCENKYILLLF